LMSNLLFSVCIFCQDFSFTYSHRCCPGIALHCVASSWLQKLSPYIDAVVATLVLSINAYFAYMSSAHNSWQPALIWPYDAVSVY